MYGQTEATARLSYLPPEKLNTKIRSIGRGIPDVELRVLNDDGEPIKPGEVGEIIARGDNISPGYFNDPESSAGKFINGALHTGDLATVDEDGDIYVVVHIVVVPANADSVVETVAYLAELGVPAIALSSPLEADAGGEESRLQIALEEARDAVHEHDLTLVWDLAAPYSHVNPVEVETGLPPEQVVRQHLYVEPDGDVLPAQGYNVVLGNLLRDPWENIWDHVERKKLME